LRALGLTSRRRLVAILEALPWTCMHGAVSNADLDSARAEIAELATRLHTALRGQ
jgi:hypothetical protein